MSPVGEYRQVQNSDVLEWYIQKLIYFIGLNAAVLEKKKKEVWPSETWWFSLHRQYVYNRKIFKDVFRLENSGTCVVWIGSCNKEYFVLLCAGLYIKTSLDRLCQCFSTAGPRPGTGPWHQLYRAAISSPGICHFSFLSIFHE